MKGGCAPHQGERKVRGDKGRRLVQVITEEEEPLRAGAPWAVVGLPGGSIVHSWVSLASCIYPGLQASGLAASCPCCAGPPCIFQDFPTSLKFQIFKSFSEFFQDLISKCHRPTNILIPFPAHILNHGMSSGQNRNNGSNERPCITRISLTKCQWLGF